MKKIISILLSTSILCLSCTSSFASFVGKVIGTAYHTDIIAYINNYAIPSYAANGTSVIVAEDLRNFGFDVVFDNNSRTLNITRNQTVYPSQMNFEKSPYPSTKFTNILYSDIAVYANGIKIPSYAINGYTMVPIESLTMLGTCNWVAEQRSIKLWVDGLHIRNSMQNIKTEFSEDTAYNMVEQWIINQYGNPNSVNLYPIGTSNDGLKITNGLRYYNWSLYSVYNYYNPRVHSCELNVFENGYIIYHDSPECDYSIIYPPNVSGIRVNTEHNNCIKYLTADIGNTSIITLSEAATVASTFCSTNLPISNSLRKQFINEFYDGNSKEYYNDVYSVILEDCNSNAYLFSINYITYREMVSVNKYNGQVIAHGGYQDYVPGWIVF